MRQMRVLARTTSKDLAKAANESMIEQKDVVSIIWREGQFIMFYYQ